MNPLDAKESAAVIPLLAGVLAEPHNHEALSGIPSMEVMTQDAITRLLQGSNVSIRVEASESPDDPVVNYSIAVPGVEIIDVQLRTDAVRQALARVAA